MDLTRTVVCVASLLLATGSALADDRGDRIEEHREAGRRLVMATTTPYDLIKPFADDLTDFRLGGFNLPLAAAEALAPVADVVVPGAAEGPVSPGAPVVDGTQQIVLSFSGPCWVDVRDSTRKFKLFGEMPKGSRRVLGGEPPYQLVIGNARAVTIEINGEPFDISRFAKGNVARFTLDP